MNDIRTATVVGDCNYEANLRGVVGVVGERGICEYHNLE